ncbi:glycosyltransferase [Acetobacter tropicalis NRIC 0312]|uniref:Glycosyl transferase n=1 Tax=Acetobacter tropicalis TaxID=104102 RepID=A0A511FPS8_9PROT|nr:glycosyltransferase family 2 protein [Acetobacter tropicalis]GAL99110.1 glycosyltransferase [Acetobacter tropicalis]GBR67201.1 glycosyltransferase [Acetobacter tropicalis NRIC 0312]GEL50919.1 glycosyl transferase [Acetobacter tropicalis]
MSEGAELAETLTLIVPCYNEQPILLQSAHVLEKQLQALIKAGLVAQQSKILFVDDGSTDQTWAVIADLAARSSSFSGVKLSRNVGHQNALLAGLMAVQVGACITIDADLQDPVDVMNDMVAHYRGGCQVVYGIRQDRTSDTFFKRTTARFFYRFMTIMGVESIENHADYRLLGPKARKAVLSFTEENLYLRGIVPLVGFQTASVYYTRAPRVGGKSKYTLLRMVALALRGVTSFSVVPLRMIALLGVSVFLLGLLSMVWSVVDKLFFQPAVGWASLNAVICLIGGLQMLALGIVGEYIGCIYTEVKRRPRFFVEQTL